MKKLIFISIVGLLMVLVKPANAQVQMAIGIKGGLNFATLDLNKSPGVNYDSRTGYHAGAYVMFKFTKLAIQPEVIFSKQGQTVTFNSQNYNSNYDYINIPIMVKFYVAGGFNLQAGPQFGFLTGANGPYYNPSTTNVSTQDLKSYVKSSDISLGLGFGWDLPFGLNVGARYNWGLSDINKQTGVSTGSTNTAMSNSETKNQVFQVSVGYRLFKFGS